MMMEYAGQTKDLTMRKKTNSNFTSHKSLIYLLKFKLNREFVYFNNELWLNLSILKTSVAML